MELLDLMKYRRSVREFKDEAIVPEKLEKILQAGQLAPSSKNGRPVDFIVVEDRAIIAKLVDARKCGTRALKEATCAIVVIVDKKSDVWQEDGAIAMSHMMLMAANLGLGSCWIQGWNRTAPNGETSEDYVRDLLHFPENYGYLATLAIGVPKEEITPNEDIFDEKKVHWGSFRKE